MMATSAELMYTLRGVTNGRLRAAAAAPMVTMQTPAAWRSASPRLLSMAVEPVSSPERTQTNCVRAVSWASCKSSDASWAAERSAGCCCANHRKPHAEDGAEHHGRSNHGACFARSRDSLDNEGCSACGKGDSQAQEACGEMGIRSKQHLPHGQ